MANTKPVRPQIDESANLPAGSDQDIYTDPALKLSVADDPLARFIARSWRQLLVAMLAAGAIWYVANSFKETHLASLKTAADTFARVRDSYSELQASDRQRLLITAKAAASKTPDAAAEKELAALDTKITDQEKNIAAQLDSLADAKEPYRTVATVYRSLMVGRSGDIAAMQKIFSPRAWEGIKELTSPDRFMAEFGAIAQARLMIDNPTVAADGEKLLHDLVERGSFVSLSAASTLGALAQTDEQKQEVIALLNGLKERRRDQLALIDQELEKLGASN